MSILKTASSPKILDQVYPVPVETASKDTQLGYKHVLHVVQSQESVQSGTSVRRHMFGLFDNWRKSRDSNEVSQDVSNCKYI